jgi:hypothetical protein
LILIAQIQIQSFKALRFRSFGVGRPNRPNWSDQDRDPTN